MVFLALFMYIMSYPKTTPDPVTAIVEDTPATTTTTTTSTTTTLDPFHPYRELMGNRTVIYLNRTINETIIINTTEYVNITQTAYIYELSPNQLQQIDNMRPTKCMSPPCSQGYAMAKDDCRSIVGLATSKYSEAWGTGYDPMFRWNQSLICFDGGEMPITLPAHHWRIIFADGEYQLWNLKNE